MRVIGVILIYDMLFYSLSCLKKINVAPTWRAENENREDMAKLDGSPAASYGGRDAVKEMRGTRLAGRTSFAPRGLGELEVTRVDTTWEMGAGRAPPNDPLMAGIGGAFRVAVLPPLAWAAVSLL